MRILLLTHVAIYPPDGGAKMKTWQVLQYLVQRHDIFYCTFTRSQEEQDQLQRLPIPLQQIVTVPLQRSWCKDIYFLIKSLLSNEAFLLLRDDDWAMRVQVERLLYEEKIDVLHVDQLNMMRFVPADWPGKVVLDEHNAVWLVVERLRQGRRNPVIRWLLRREVMQVRRIEGEACRRAQVVLAVSEQDRAALQETAGPDARIVVVPITVDCQRFASIRQARKPVPGRLLSIGTLFWPPNSEGIAWWLRTGYASLQDCYPAVTYDIVGARPPRRLRALVKRHITVRLHGYVRDAGVFWSQAAALAVPLLTGGGIRVKILEAMAIGVPVITTSIGCEGLNVRDREHVLIADTPVAFARACIEVFSDPQLADRLAKNAYELLCERYDAQKALEPLEIIYDPSQNRSD
jgi:glycosyltransferase involved in cell wall biosynthesis